MKINNRILGFVSILSAIVSLPPSALANENWTAKNFVHWSSNAVKMLDAKSKGPIAGYSPAQIKAAYGIDRYPNQGAGQTIAIVDAYGNPSMEDDLNTFSKQFGLPTTSEFSFSVQYVNQLPNRSDPGSAGAVIETSLDVEWAHAIAPRAAIILVVVKSLNMGDLLEGIMAASQLGANVVSMSFGSAELAQETSIDAIFNIPGVTFVAASGDNGAGVSYPAASPYVVAVGGTTLRLNSQGGLTSKETAWSGSGGGISQFESQPTYQSGAQKTGKRTVPDVAYDADPATGYAIYFTPPQLIQTKSGTKLVSGWFSVGGTSAGAPQWAALVADSNSQRASADFLSELYQIGTGQSYSADFRQITDGCNGPDRAIDCATKGYNFVTGLGSPLAENLFPAIGKEYQTP